MEQQSLPHLLLQHRKKAGLSRNQLAELAEVGKTTIFKLEHGDTRVNFDSLLKVMQVLNISLLALSPMLGNPVKLTNIANENVTS